MTGARMEMWNLRIFKEKKPATVLALMLLGTPAVAQEAVCSFSLECFESETCAETAFEITLNAKQADADDFQITTDAETVTGKGRMTEAGGFLFQGGNANGAALLTVGAQGAARYSVQYFEGPMVITYHGQCGEFS